MGNNARPIITEELLVIALLQAAPGHYSEAAVRNEIRDWRKREGKYKPVGRFILPAAYDTSRLGVDF